MITESQITAGAKFKTESGIVWIIDAIEDDNLVRTSMEGGQKGNYRDPIGEVVAFFNEQNVVQL